MKRISVANYTGDKYYPRVVRAVASILERGDVVAPIEVFIEMGLLKRESVADWRAGRVPFLERAIECNLSAASRVLRLLRLHSHDLDLRPSITVYCGHGTERRRRLRFSKTGDTGVEEAYARHFVRVLSKKKSNPRASTLMRSIALTLLTSLVAATASAQTPRAVIGTWRLVSFVSPDSTGQLRPGWGEHPSGLIIYTSDGHVSAQLYDPRRARLGAIGNATPFDAAQPRFGGLYTYFGTFSVDTIAHTVSHRVEGAMAPDWVGSTLVRAYRFLGPDRIELRVVTDASGRTVANGSVLVWERVRR